MPRVVAQYKEKAKERIAEVAHKVFSEKGYHETTMDDIAERLGVSKGALYQYFKSKEELYRAILVVGYQGLTGLLQSTSSGGGSFTETCEKFLDDLTTDTSGLGLDFEVMSEAQRNPALKKIVRENYEETTQVIEQCLRELEKESSLRKNIDIHMVTQGLIALYDGLMFSLAIGVDKSEVKKIFAEFIRIMERGMLQKPT